MRSRYINLYFLLPSLLFILLLFYFLITTQKGQSELFINRHNNFLFDWFFYLITEIGNGWFFTLVCIIILLFFKTGNGLFLGVQGILTTIYSNICKHVLFPNAPRPLAFFDKSVTLHFVQGSEKFYSNSFPSGHSITAFCMFCTLSFFLKERRWGLLFAIMAMLVGISRIYLLKHFLLDVSVGATSGLILSLLTLFFLYPIFERAKPLQKPLLSKLI